MMKCKKCHRQVYKGVICGCKIGVNIQEPDFVKCFVCDVPLGPRQQGGHVCIVMETRPHSVTNNLYFHITCFAETAGQEYIDAMSRPPGPPEPPVPPRRKVALKAAGVWIPAGWDAVG